MKHILILLLSCSWISVFPQVKQPDSVKTLNEVTISVYSYLPRSLLRSTGSESFIGKEQMENQSQSSFVGVLNTVPGARMEERSPGSYRLSLRGSLLRSPFGIRNVKIYFDEFPLTDAGGNTYLNLIDAAAIYSMEILKGPQASIFGANTGGAIVIHPTPAQINRKEIDATTGSYGLFHQTAKAAYSFKNYQFSLNEGYQTSDGYRENSALERKYLQTIHQWDYNKNGKLKALLFYSDLAYETPGGLTEAQLLVNPKAARPATSSLPSAISQQAGIYNKTLFGGLSNSYRINTHLQHVIALFGNYTDFKNPFITNYEKRREQTYGIRSFINYHSRNRSTFFYDTYLGIESSRTKTDIRNYVNDKGTPIDLLASDNLVARQDFAFFKFNIDINSRLLIELGSSLNFFDYAYESYFPVVNAQQKRSFKAQLMPKIAASYLINEDFGLRGTLSKGYSPPTLAEVRASDNVINNSLAAEAGWNYEGGLTYQNRELRLMVDAGLFYFNLKNAIVRRLTATDAEYFVNAGGTKQLGTELQVSWAVLPPNLKGFLRGLNLNSSFTYNHFRFEEFKNAAQDFSGNRLTGVPKQTWVSSLDFTFVKGFYLFAQHNYTSAIPLNDANTVYGKKYHLGDLKMGVRNWSVGKMSLDLSFGINNIFNQRYSLGNDLNAANGRYYNVAPGINYYGGLGVRF